MSNRDVWKAVNWMDRSQLEAILESHGFAVYDSESNDELREAIVANVEDGTIDVSDLEADPADLPDPRDR